MSYFVNLEIIDNKTGFFANLGEHSMDRYFTVKGFQIIKLCNLTELGKFIFLTKVKIPKMTKLHVKRIVLPYTKYLCKVNLPLLCYLLLILCTLRRTNSWYLWRWEIPAKQNDFLTITGKNWKDPHFTVGRHRRFKLSGKLSFFVAFRN